jgi:hypothetical protein
MQANTKLDTFEKRILKQLKIDLAGVDVMIMDGKTTMAFKPLGNTVEFALSVMAPTEKKFRRKVGEYWALIKFENGQTVKMAVEDFNVMTDSVWGYSDILPY